MVCLALLGTTVSKDTITAPTISTIEAEALQTIKTTTELKNPLVAQIQAKNRQEITLLNKEAVNFISAQYELDHDKMLKTIQCESGFNTTAIGDDGRSYGIAQFTKPTFKENCRGDYKNTFDQLVCMSEMWKKGMQNRWTCYRNLFNKK